MFSIDQQKDSKAIHSAILLKVEREAKVERSCWHRLSWSPRIGRTYTTGSEGEVSLDNDLEELFLTTTSQKRVEVWKMSAMNLSAKHEKKLKPNDLANLKRGYVAFEAHEEAVTDVSLAPGNG